MVNLSLLIQIPKLIFMKSNKLILAVIMLSFLNINAQQTLNTWPFFNNDRGEIDL
jgi:hypothetical protein